MVDKSPTRQLTHLSAVTSSRPLGNREGNHWRPAVTAHCNERRSTWRALSPIKEDHSRVSPESEPGPQSTRVPQSSILQSNSRPQAGFGPHSRHAYRVRSPAAVERGRDQQRWALRAAGPGRLISRARPQPRGRWEPGACRPGPEASCQQ